jgi:hypothetical protein
VPKHFTAELTKETAEAIGANTNHCVTGYYFFKFLQGIQVGQELVPIKVALTGEFAKKMNVEGKVITIRENGFFDSENVIQNDIWTRRTSSSVFASSGRILLKRPRCS